MALTEPLNLLDGFPGWSTDFSLYARQEQSRHASGRTRVKDFGTPLWRASWVSKPLNANLLDRWRARIEQAMLSQMTFMGWQSSRARPMLHSGAAALPAGTLNAIGANNRSVRVSGLPGISLAPGDMMRIGNGLYRLQEEATGNPTGFFEITPHLWAGVGTGQAVVISKPWCLMTVDPGSLSAAADPRTGRGSISFTATEAR